MFKQITIRGLGPHLDTTVAVDPKGVTEIAGPSESGKSTVIEALCLGVFGVDSRGKALDTGAINVAADRAEVELTTASSNVLRRSVTRKGSKSRQVIKFNQDPETIGSEEEWRKTLGPLGRPWLRLVVVPMAWHDLAEGEGGGRPLRDLVASLLPTVDMRAEVSRIAGFEVGPNVTLDPKQAEKNVTAANKARDEAAGGHKALVGADQTAEIPRRPEADIEPSRAVLHCDALWRGYDMAANASKREADEHRRRVEDYEKRRDAVGLEPERITSDRNQDAYAVLLEAAKAAEAAKRAHEDGRTAMVNYEIEMRRWSARLAEIDAEIERFEATETAGAVCPTCHQPWSEAEAHQQATRLHLYSKRKPHAVEPSLPDVDVNALREAEDAALAALADANALRDEVRAKSQAHAAWRHLAEAVGSPPKRSDGTVVPPIPTVPRPNDGEMRQARDAIAKWERHNNDADAAERAKAGRKAGIDAAAIKLQAAIDAAKWSAKLLEAIRKAPSEIARRQSDEIGDLGCVSLVWTDAGGVDVLVDGRAWERASTGRKIVADYHFRRALRRLCNAPWMPIVIDQAQSWVGAPLEVEGPAILLRTTEGEFRVEVTS